MTAKGQRLRVLVAHNAYRHRGGEDMVSESEIRLLRGHGHDVMTLVRRNDDLERTSRLRAVCETVWSQRTVLELRQAIRQFAPDVIHVHNTFPVISPSLYWAADKLRVPVVQTLHNFRLLCPQAMLLRDGRVCEVCVGRFPLPGVIHGCYRGSVAQTSVAAAMLGVHRALGTYRSKVTRYVALNEFCRRKFIEGGLPAHRIVVKPNFVEMPVFQPGERVGFLFVGRLSPEKGVETLAGAASRVEGATFRVAGDGSEAARLEGLGNVCLLGAIGQASVRNEMLRAQALILPSIWYENFPRTLVEAFSCGLPVIASRLGALPELIEDGVTGLLFDPGSEEDLAEKMRWAECNPLRMRKMGLQAREVYESKYTAEQNYQMLMSIYQDVINEAGRDNAA